jgi:Mg2+/citrate symporter
MGFGIYWFGSYSISDHSTKFVKEYKMRNEVSYTIERPSKMDRLNWKWVLIPLAVILCVALIIIAAMHSGILFYIGLAVFFILGFIVGQSRTWYAIRKTWNHFTTTEEDED